MKTSLTDAEEAVAASPANMDTTMAIVWKTLKNLFVIHFSLSFALGYGFVITRGSKGFTAHRRIRFASAREAECYIRRTFSGMRNHGSPIFHRLRMTGDHQTQQTAKIRLASPLEMTCRDGDTIAELQQPEQKAAKLCTGDLGA